MSQAAVLPFSPPWQEASSEASDRVPLSDVAPGESSCVVELALESDMAAWLRAVGIAERERVTVLRRAVFGGPIHVRTSSGGEFALNASLAASVLTRRLAPDGRPPR